MRLDRLALERFGRFGGAVLEFGAPPVDGRDVTVIFGPNEAGKSTADAAWLDLLGTDEEEGLASTETAWPTCACSGGRGATHADATRRIEEAEGQIGEAKAILASALEGQGGRG